MPKLSEQPSILYEDNHLLVVVKPVNLPVQADASGDPDLLSVLKAYIKEKYGKPGEVYLGLVHRLDRPVGGVMVFARTSKAAARLTAQFRSHGAKKRYCAVVEGDAEPEASLTDWLLKDEATHTTHVVDPSTAGAKDARLRYVTLGRRDGRTLVDVELYTGRSHQIRVQLSHAGLPIVGDQRYNPGAKIGTQIALFSYALTIEHPTTKEQMTFTCLPEGGAFDTFSSLLPFLPAFPVCRGVYADEAILVADKNRGVETETDLTAELMSIFGEVYPVHRLDANTEGLVLFARDEDTRDRLTALFQTHALTKRYLAVVSGVTEPAGRLVNWLKKDADSATVRAVREGTPDAKRAELCYRRIGTDGENSLVEVELLTGRTHQIRVQLAKIGHPVLGDDKYGDRNANRAYRQRTQLLLAKYLMIDGHTFESERTLTLPKRGSADE